MEFHQGRLLDHVHLEVSDLERSKRFYATILKVLGREITGETPDHFSSDELWVTEGETPTQGLHLAFQATDPEKVREFHAAGVAAGGTDNGAPGEREYHPGYFAAYLLDPDGNNIEAVYHGPVERTTESIVVRAGPTLAG